MLAETHVHTHYSRGTKILYDGVAPPEEMVAVAARKGIGALAITDHSTMAGMKAAKAAGKKHGVIIIPGEEITSAHGHIVALGISEEIRRGLPAEESIDRIREQGGLAVASHPFDIARFGLGTRAQLCDAVEVFNALNLDRLANYRSYLWVRSKGLVGIAASDAHHPELLGLGLSELSDNCDSVDSVLRAIRRGSFVTHAKYAPLGVLIRWNVIRMQVSYDHTMNYILGNYRGTKKFLSRWLLKTTRFSPGRIDYFYRLLAYIGVGYATVYSAVRGGRLMHAREGADSDIHLFWTKDY